MRQTILSVTRLDSSSRALDSKFGVDYIETFAPTVRPSTLHILLLFAAQKGAAVHQCDVKNAYLYSRLENNIIIYSELPPNTTYSVNYCQNSEINQELSLNGSYQFTGQSKVLTIGMLR